MKGPLAEVTWPGTDADGHTFADGAYTAVVSASSALGKASPRTVKVSIDTGRRGSPAPTSAPARSARTATAASDTVTVRYVPAGAAAATRVAIVATDGKVRRQLTDWRGQSTAARSATWDGKVSSDGKLVAAAEGEYLFSVECRDVAGNVSRQGIKVALDRTLGFPTATPGTLSPNGDGAKDSTMLGFKLTRSATVRIAVKVDGKTVRSFKLGLARRRIPRGRVGRRDRRRSGPRQLPPDLHGDSAVFAGRQLGRRGAGRRPRRAEALGAGGAARLARARRPG